MTRVYFADTGLWVRDRASIDPPPPVVPPGTTAFGTSVFIPGQNEAQAFATLKAQFGNVPLIRVYFGASELLPANYISNSLLAAAYAGGAKKWVISVKWGGITGAGAILGGAHDAELNAFLASLPGDVELFFSWYHEPDNDNLSTGDQTTYRQAWDYIAPLVRSHNHKTTMICTKFILNNDPTAEEWRKYYSAGAVDVIGFDAYNVGRKSNPPVYSPASNIMGPIITLATSENKEWGIGETGSPIISSDVDGQGRATWLTDCCTMAQENHAAYYCYWNRAALDGSVDFTIKTNDPYGTTVYSAFMA